MEVRCRAWKVLSGVGLHSAARTSGIRPKLPQGGVPIVMDFDRKPSTLVNSEVPEALNPSFLSPEALEPGS